MASTLKPVPEIGQTSAIVHPRYLCRWNNFTFRCVHSTFNEPKYHIYSFIHRGIALVCIQLGVQKLIVAFHGKQESVYDEKISL